MIDWHSHVLPKMDDGSRSIEESLKLINMQHRQGVDKIIATPHFYANDESVNSFLERRQASFELLKPNLAPNAPQIILGAEVKYYHGISKMENLKALRAQDSEILLLEMPFSRWTEYMLREITEMSLMGNVKLVLAHIERYLSLQSREVMEKVYSGEIFTQVNASFFANLSTRRKAVAMLRQGKIHFVGSDCHNTTSRPPRLDSAFAVIERKLGPGFLIQMDEYGQSMLV